MIKKSTVIYFLTVYIPLKMTIGQSNGLLEFKTMAAHMAAILATIQLPLLLRQLWVHWWRLRFTHCTLHILHVLYTHTHTIGTLSGSVCMRLSNSPSDSWEKILSNTHSTAWSQSGPMKVCNMKTFLHLLHWCEHEQCVAHLITLLSICMIWVAVVRSTRGSYTEGERTEQNSSQVRQDMLITCTSDSCQIWYFLGDPTCSTFRNCMHPIFTHETQDFVWSVKNIEISI